MFTGLVETLGLVAARAEEAGGRRLTLRAPLAAELRLGASVAVNGACLTVIERNGDDFAFQLGPETLARTNLGVLLPGDRVNLERALRVGDQLDGHWVLGHIDGRAHLAARRREGDYEIVRFDCPAELAGQMIPKGSVAVDGVSLTLVDVEPESFSVMLIPHTLSVTTLGFRRVGEAVNLELDVLGKYVLKYLQALPLPGNP